jgi:ubiquinone/menaquinone biosynthesis C-methylase UbiE
MGTSETHDVEWLREHWDAFASQFEAEFEPSTQLLARTLLAHLQLDQASAFLEVGGGAGAAGRAALDLLAPDARCVITDLSPEMVARARAKLGERAEARDADAEQLPFAEASFDRYLANLNLMLVPDPDRALAEAARVLRPGGLAAWSVWGRPEHSSLFTLPPRAAEAVGLELEGPARSNFHLHERDALRERIAGAGFRDLLAWYQPLTLPIRSGAALTERLLRTPRWRQNLAQVDAATQDRLAAEMTRLADEHLAAGQPIALEALVVVARRA